MLCFCMPLCGYAEIFTYVDRGSGVTVISNVPLPSGSDYEIENALAIRNRSARTGAAARPAGFPVVSSQLQKERDRDRRDILQKELESEQRSAEVALSRSEPASIVHRHLENIAALKRELSALHSQ